MTGDFHRAVSTFLFTNPLFVLYYTHIHWNDKEAIGTSVPMAFAFDATEKPL